MKSQKMIYALRYLEDGSTEEKRCYDIDKIDYESKYRGNLRCINGCEARIKFTQRKNNNKFFSTWNKEGDKHNVEGCPYAVIYKGKLGRKRLKEFYDNMQVDDDHIENTILNKARNIQNEYKGIKVKGKNEGSYEVTNIGEGKIVVPKESTEGKFDYTGKKRVYIQGKDANYLTTDDISRKICIYGIGNNTQLEMNKDNTSYGYINLKNMDYTVSALFSQNFYTDKEGMDEDIFKKFMTILKYEMNGKADEKNFVIVAYGEIGRKSKKGLNILINSPRHILINDMKVSDILRLGKINDIDYTIK